MTRAKLMRAVWRLPILRRLGVRRAIWNAHNALVGARRALFERCGSDRYSHPALFGIDRELARRLPQQQGFFVEAGANDGFLQSNTYWLERFRHWDGVLVEPVPHLAAQARRRRRRATVVNCALVSPQAEGTSVRLRYGGLMSVVAGVKGGGEEEDAYVRAGDMNGLDDYDELDVPGRTLTSVLAEAGAPAQIDLLTLDVEGSEVEALKGLDLERYQPRVMLVEALDAERQQQVEAVIGRYYEYVEHLSPHDLVYVRRGAAGR
jgi:FkbM family methyltransferase